MLLKHKYIYGLAMLFFFGLGCKEILTVEDISEETPVLLAPLNGTEVAPGAVFFSWQKLRDASQYHLQLATPNFENASQVLLDTLLESTFFSKELAKNSYEWRLQALNSDFETQYVKQPFVVAVSDDEKSEANNVFLD